MAARLVPLAALVGTVAAWATLAATPLPAAAATHATTTTTSTSAPSAVTRSAHIAYENCPAQDVVLSVSVPRHTYAIGQPVTYRVSLHNESGRRCSVPGSQASSLLPNASASSLNVTQLGFLLGPCSPLPLTIENAKGVEVFPGPEAISCPAFQGPPLAAHTTISTTGTWDQMVGGGLRPARVATPAPAGLYRIKVGSKVSVPITLVGVPPAPGAPGAGRGATTPTPLAP
jgi:hypothetical protein